MAKQLAARRFDGDTYDEGRDGDRLGAQLSAVKQVMLDLFGEQSA